MNNRRLTLQALGLIFTVTLLSSCSVTFGTSKSSSEEVSVCTILKERIELIEDESKIIRIAPLAAPGIRVQFGLNEDLQKAGYPLAIDSKYSYSGLYNFLAVAESCLSEDAIDFLNNSLNSPVNIQRRIQDGNF